MRLFRMKKVMTVLSAALLCLIVGVSPLWSQGKLYEGPDDPAGDIAAEREGYMTGNRVYLYFQNTTELAKWVNGAVGSQWSRWPNNLDGVRMLDGIALLVGARVYLENDTIPVTDIQAAMGRTDLDTLYYLQTSYREEMDTNPTGTIEWGFYPVFGYFNENSEYPAMSNHPSSWPTAGWPASGDQLVWPGEWNGRFGRGKVGADLETYFVVNDAQDLEYLGPEDRVKYYPRPGVRIGDKRPDVTIQYGQPWGGLGLRVEQRGFQWNNPQARDCIFWEYTIANISDYDIPEVAFGYWVDNGIGGERDDELGYFDRKIDLAYSWDVDGIGQGGLSPGVMGFAYLESPGISQDGVDNDEDGLTDEQRDNNATAEVDPTYGITNLTNFLDFYNLKAEDLRVHWDADEDQDWDDGDDLNGDGIYQITEDAGDDVGLDGVGPAELNYTGPDEGECNHMPDRREGDSEPDFAETDVSESDMVGLTSFQLFPVPSHSSEYHWFRGDKSMWEILGSDTLVEYLGNISNLIETFASGPFSLYQGRTERISMAEVHSYDALSGLNSEAHSAPALFEAKRIVQVIYESDYRFAKPPEMPTLQATAADGKVILSWDDRADTKTRDPFLRNENDFEGYKLYRATDKRMSDAEVITDGYGTPMLKKPIFQCDLIDGITGFTDFGLVNGVGYYLGDDSGITHYFVDNDVQNGRTYYYALVAYDYGAPDIGPGIAPSENSIYIDLDESEAVRSVGPNVQIVVPHPQAAGYTGPEVDSDDNGLVFGAGTVEPEILAKGDLKAGHQYRVTFSIDTVSTVEDYALGFQYVTSGFAVHDVTDGGRPVYQETPEKYAFENIIRNDTLGVSYLRSGVTLHTDIFEGMRLNIYQPLTEPVYDSQHSGWLVGDAPIRIVPTVEESKYFPWDYEIRFTDSDTAYTGVVTVKTMRDENGTRINRNALLTGESFPFYVVNTSFPGVDGSYDVMDLVVQDMNGDGIFSMAGDRVLVGPVNDEDRWAGTAFIIDFMSSTDFPEANDVYSVTFRRPFFDRDSLLFTVSETPPLDEAELAETLKKVKVVPNPYVATNAMEPAVGNWRLNQRRRIIFTNIPAECTIRIFTVSGVLVDEIDVNNDADNGLVHWDLLTKEGLEVAAGMYLYHLKAKTGDEQMGKFAIIK
ncbi:hypothetical protein JXO52_01905 [bacterium]|nr:hypothetical protein [bacterium]